MYFRSAAICYSIGLALFPSSVNASLFDTILNAVKNAVDCTSCHALLAPIKLVAKQGDPALITTFTKLCQTLKIEADDVCEGIMAQEGPIIAHSLRSISVTGSTATKLCDALLGLCELPPVHPHTVTFPKSATSGPVLVGGGGVRKKPWKVIHMTDVHIDREYTAGTEASCKAPICCRPSSSLPGVPISSPAGPNGDHRCDTPETLVDSYFEAVNEFGGDAKLALFTGDVVETSIWSVTEDHNKQDMHAFNADLSSKLKMPAYGAIGNHEAAPVNSFPRNTTDTVFTAQWVFDTQSKDWTQWIGGDAAEELRHDSGSYSTLVPGTNLRIISLNTLYWYKANFWLFDSDKFQPDPNGILEFLVTSLQKAEDAGQHVWIIGHMPPGGPDAMRDQSNYFDQIIQRYKRTITASFFGHSHNDEFEIAYSNYGQQTAATATSVAHIAPALTPRNGNPELKIYDIDPDTYEVMDFTLYIANMSSPTYQEKIKWEKFYSARESYGPLVNLQSTEPLTPAVMHNITTALEKKDVEFEKYNERFSRAFNVPSCTGDCERRRICAMRAMRSENNCYVPNPGFNFKRSVEQHPDMESHCEGSKFKSIFQKMIGKGIPMDGV